MDILGKRKIWYVISGLLILFSLFFLFTQGLNYGIDFMGGTMLRFSFEEEVTNEEVRQVLTEIGLVENAQIQQVEEEGLPYGVMIRTGELSPDQTEEVQQIESAFQENFSGTILQSHDAVGGVIGQELRRNAIMALIIAAIGMIVYISIRFELRFAIVAIITLLHDVIFTAGVFAFLGREVNTAFMAALLMILGYSINDTIVIFDRIRENMNLLHRKTFVELANEAVVDTLPRSVNTSITTLIAVLAIYIFGGAAIRTFMLALLLGILIGTYSSVFVASPLLVTWGEKFSEATVK